MQAVSTQAGRLPRGIKGYLAIVQLNRINGGQKITWWTTTWKVLAVNGLERKMRERDLSSKDTV